MLTRIDIENFRCIEAASIEFDARATGVIGDNASGKTSLLEAIYFLGHGRSFRTQHRDKLLRAQADVRADYFRIVGRLWVDLPRLSGEAMPGPLAATASQSRGWSPQVPAPLSPGTVPAAGAGSDTPSVGDGAPYSPGQTRDESGPDYAANSWDGDTGLGQRSNSDRSGRSLVAGIEYVNGATRANLAGQGVSGIADIAEVLPIQIIDPGIHRLIEEGSARRRRLMDWGVFHVKQDFLGSWRRYQRALLQRNAALKIGAEPAVVEAWEKELSNAGTVVDALRADYVQQLEPHFQRIVTRLVGSSVRFVYRRGWVAESDLETAYRESRARDLRFRTTHVGPHRADLSFMVDDAAARDRISRGQQKMLAAAFILSQLALRVAVGAPQACLMLDDPAAELDVDNLGKLLSVIAEIPAQLVVTSVHERGLQGIDIARRFHVKHGHFQSML